MTRPGSLARNVLSNWIGIPITVAYGLVITPIIVRALDTELYGVWSFLNGLLMYSDLLYVGLGSALIKYVAQHRANDDQAGHESPHLGCHRHLWRPRHRVLRGDGRHERGGPPRIRRAAVG